MNVKVLTYNCSDIDQIVAFMEQITVQGIKNARMITAIANIIDTGKIGEIIDKGVDANGVE